MWQGVQTDLRRALRRDGHRGCFSQRLSSENDGPQIRLLLEGIGPGAPIHEMNENYIMHASPRHCAATEPEPQDHTAGRSTISLFVHNMLV